MKGDFSIEWWMWEMNRHVAQLIHDPSEQSEARLKALIMQYRRERECELRCAGAGNASGPMELMSA